MFPLNISFLSGKNQVRKRTRRQARPPYMTASDRHSVAEALYPLLASGYSRLDTVSQDYKKLFGTEPKHPHEGEYSWVGYELSSNQYGTPSNKTRPPYEEGDRDFGLFSHFETFSVEMQFEQNGLRTRMTWKLSEDWPPNHPFQMNTNINKHSLTHF